MYRNRVIKGLLSPLLLAALAQTSFAQEGNGEGFSVFEKTKEVKKKKRKKKTQKHEFNGYAASGLGYDSNPYLTPSSPYYDFSAGQQVTPDIKSGFFVPLFVRGDYEYRYSQDVRFLADVKFSGKYFTDKALENANQYKSKIKGGVRFRFNRYKREINRIDASAYVGNVYEIYVDHDDGELKETIGGDQSNRYQYKKAGAELAYRYDFRKVDLYVRGRYEYRDYEDPATWAPLDHTYTRLKVEGGYQLTKPLHLGAYYEFRMRDYTDRKSYQIESDGLNINLSGPAGVVYTYNDLKLFGEYRFTRAYKMDLSYLLSARQDDNQGYSDYLYHRISWINKYKFSKKLRSSLKLSYYLYDYKNAYAFNQLTTLDKLEDSGYKAYLNTKYKFAENWVGNLDLLYRKEISTDKRYEYEEMIAMALLKYGF